MPLKFYKKEDNFSYAIGYFACFELLSSKSECVKKLLVAEISKLDEKTLKLVEKCDSLKIPVETAPAQVAKLSHSDNCQCLAVFEKYEDKLSGEGNHILLFEPSDPGNLGTIIRTMVGFGFFDLAIITPAVDIFEPKIIRASTGQFFKIRRQLFESFADYAKKYPRKFFALDASSNTVLESSLVETPHTLIFGNEVRGLPDEILNSSTKLKIPTSEIESLNLAVSCGIAMYEFSTK